VSPLSPTGPRGGRPKPNPAIRLLRHYTNEIARLEERLGIGLLSRMRLGIAFAVADKALAERSEPTAPQPEWVKVETAAPERAPDDLTGPS
jgi:hypothetical protein